MKKIYLLIIAFVLAIFTSCASVGVALKGSNYFENKKEEDLVKYFKYEGETVEQSEEYDKVLHFTNEVTTMFMDKTTTKKFKNRTYKLMPEYTFSFFELYDGCYLSSGTNHLIDILYNGRIDKIINRDISENESRKEVAKEPGVRYHTNNNSEIRAKVKSFNNFIQQYGAVKENDDNTMFDKTNIGNTYYIYEIKTNRTAYSDNDGSSTAICHNYKLQSVSVYEDSKTSTETHVAYIYNDKEKQYTDEKGNQISEEEAFANEKSYLNEGFENRKKNKGMALTAYIKNGVIIKIVPDTQ